MNMMIQNPGMIDLFWQAGEHGVVQLAASSDDTGKDFHFDLSGTSAADADSTYDGDHGLKLATAGGATDFEQMLVLPAAGADNQSLWREINWGTENEVEWECVLRTNTLINLGRIECGLVLTAPSAMDEGTDANQVKFSYLQGTDTNWEVNMSIGGADTVGDSNVVVVANSVYHFRIAIDKDRLARFSINSRLVHTSPSLADNINLLPYVGVQAGTATLANSINLRSVAISRVLAS